MESVITERLIVRRPRESDLQDFLAYHNHPDVLKSTHAKPMTKEKAQPFLERQARMEIGDESGWVMFAVENRSEGRVIGEVGIYLAPEPESTGDIGWIIHPDYQGNGYATEAARLLLSFGFAERGLHRITSACDSRNSASFRLMERLGLRREGHFLQSRRVDGEWHDEYRYAILCEEWLTRQRSGE